VSTQLVLLCFLMMSKHLRKRCSNPLSPQHPVTCARVYIFTCIFLYAFMYVCACVGVCVCVCVDVCVFVCIFMCVYV
jgi:hypothetical protein